MEASTLPRKVRGQTGGNSRGRPRKAGADAFRRTLLLNPMLLSKLPKQLAGDGLPLRTVQRIMKEIREMTAERRFAAALAYAWSNYGAVADKANQVLGNLGRNLERAFHTTPPINGIFSIC